MDYENAAQLCMRLFVFVGDVPDSLLPLPKERLGQVFAELAAAGWVHQDYQSTELCGFHYGAHLLDLSTRDHWLKVIRSMLGENLYNRAKAEAVASRVGFGSQLSTGEVASPNGGPAEPRGNSGAGGGPPSVS